MAMKSAEKLFLNTDMSEVYAQFRPQPPDKLIKSIIAFIEEKLPTPLNQAVDVGCGTGQSTALLAPHFKSVLGTDVSETQIEQAKKRNTISNVEYKDVSCYSIPFPNESVELVCACEAAHWFDLDMFYKEVDRVLVVGGVLALMCYLTPTAHGQPFSDEINKILEKLYTTTMDGFWHQNIKLVENEYKDLVLPYGDNRRESIFTADANWSVANYIGYVQSWSAYQARFKKEPEKVKKEILEFQRSLQKAIGESTPFDKEVINTHWKFTLLMGRKC